MGKCDEKNINDMLSFLMEQPCEQEIIDMDCNDYCGKIARLAELVAEGAHLNHVRPALEEHLQHWQDCREEFDALVAIIQAESDGKVNSPEVEALLQEIKSSEKKST